MPNEISQQARLAHDGKENGATDEQINHPGYGAVFSLDPDGNNVDVVSHDEVDRSAESVVIAL